MSYHYVTQFFYGQTPQNMLVRKKLKALTNSDIPGKN